MKRARGKHFAVSLISLGMLLAGPKILNAHQNHDHSMPSSQKKQLQGQSPDLIAINADYLKTVKPTFQKSCFDCHSSSTRYPWYSGLPFAKGLISKDIEEAKSHLDMSKDFPFQGHGSPREDLEAILKALKENSMPPSRYRLMHWGSALSDQEKAAVNDWIERSLRVLPP